MAGIKTPFNTQFGRVLADITTAVPSPDNAGREPSLTPEGAIWTKSVPGGGSGGNSYTSKTTFGFPNVADTTIFTGACDILELYGFKKGTVATIYLQLFDKTVSPTPLEVPLICIPLVGDTTIFSLSHSPVGVAAPNFNNGIQLALSTTSDNYTAVGGGITVFATAMMGII